MATNRHNGDAAAKALQELARLDDGRMLDGAGDDVSISGPAAENTAQLGENRSLQCMIVSFGAAASEDDLAGLSAEKFSDLLAGLLDGVMSCCAEDVALDGLPKWAWRYGHIASTTAGSMGVVAL